MPDPYTLTDCEKAAQRVCCARSRRGEKRRDLRRLRRRRRRLLGADVPLSHAFRRPGQHLYSRSHLRRLRPQSGGDQPADRQRRPADRHRRLRFDQPRVAGGRRGAQHRRRRHRSPPGRRTSCRLAMRWSIRTARTIFRGRGISAPPASSSWCWSQRLRQLREAGDKRVLLDRSAAWLDIVALATVCDVVPLKGLNRAYVVKGLVAARHQGNAGLVGAVSQGGAWRAGDTLSFRLPDRPAHQCRRTHRRCGARQPAADARRCRRGRGDRRRSSTNSTASARRWKPPCCRRRRPRRWPNTATATAPPSSSPRGRTGIPASSACLRRG